MNWLTQATHLVYQFGPFAFALLFLTYIPRWSQKRLQEAATRNPPADALEKRTYLGYFIGTSLIGVVLVALSVIWWWNNRPLYIYEGSIEAVSELHSIDGSRLFTKNEYWAQDKDNPQYRDVHFMIIQNEPFVDGQEISLRHRRGASQFPLVVKVKLDEKPKLGIVYDKKRERWALVRVSAAQGESPTDASDEAPKDAADQPKAVDEGGKGSWLQLIPSAIAQDSRNMPVQSTNIDRPLGDRGALLQAIHEAGTPIPRKIEALDKLRTIPRAELAQVINMSSSASKEAVFVTLMDLTRHSDAELASKAGRVLSAAPLPTEYFARRIASRDEARIKEAAAQLLRVEPPYAERIIKELDKQRVDTSSLRRASGDGRRKLLVPTGTVHGDRYYMKAEWNEDGSVSCLDRALPSDLWTSLKGAGSGALLFGNDKSRMLQLASSFEKCAARATFVAYAPSRK